MSKIFTPYNVLGLCSSDVPFVIKYSPHSSTYYALVPVGDRFNVYKLPRLTLVAVSDPVPCPIRAFTSYGKYLFAAAGSKIYIFRNSRYLLHEIIGHVDPIVHLVALPEALLVSVDQGNHLNVWNLNSLEKISKVDFSAESFHITVVFHPFNYKNKILVGSLEGPLQLWNVVTQKMLYWFKGFGSSVSCLQQAPALDVCAVGLGDGRIVLHNIKYDITVLNFSQDGGAVTAIEFRCGSNGLRNPFNNEEDKTLAHLPISDQDVYMIAGTENGLVTCWQLHENRESRSVDKCRYMHWGRILSMCCIPGGNPAGTLVTSGADNCIKVSYFDRPDGGLRTEYRRAGHFRPPNRLLFWPGSSAGGSLLLSAGQDSVLRIFSTFNEHLDKSLGRAYAPGVPDRRKANSEERSPWLLPGFIQLSACATRSEAWDSVVALHANRRQATTWNFMNSTRGRHWLDPAKFQGRGGEAIRSYKNTVATCVYITNCGNYVLIGYSSGDVFKFNLQSGLERGSFGTPTAHIGPVIGVAVNHVNRIAITVGDLEILFWSFDQHNLVDKIIMPSSASFTRFHSESDTLAIALSNALILLVDVAHRRIIRRFSNGEDQLCIDLAISSDGRWLISAHHGDPLIKTWDIIDSKLIDCFRVSLPITSIALSKANEFLATTHSNSLGIYLWDNQATYKRLHLQPLQNDYKPTLDQPPVLLPSRLVIARIEDDLFKTDIRLNSDTKTQLLNDDTHEHENAEDYNYSSPEQLPDHLVTLSGLPYSYFTTLLNLDLISKRNSQSMIVNKDDQSLNKQNLPFFLPILETNQGLAWNDDEISELNQPNVKSNRKKRGLLDNVDKFSALEPVYGLASKLIQAKQDYEFDRIMSVLKSLGPNALDLEIHLLLPSSELNKYLKQHGSNIVSTNQQLLNHINISHDRLHGFLRFLINRLQRNLDVDFVCACLEILLQKHSDVLFHSEWDSLSNQSLDQVVENDQSNTPSTLTVKTATPTSTTRMLIQQAIMCKRKAQQTIDTYLTRSICLVDFIRNPTTALQFG